MRIAPSPALPGTRRFTSRVRLIRGGRAAAIHLRRKAPPSVRGAPVARRAPVHHKGNIQTHALPLQVAHQRGKAFSGLMAVLFRHFQQKLVMNLKDEPGGEGAQHGILVHGQHGQLDDVRMSGRGRRRSAIGVT